MYTFETTYTRKRIAVLTTAQMHTFRWRQAVITFLAGFALAVFSLMFYEKNAYLAIPLALGCWMCVSAWYPAQYYARKIWKRMGEQERVFSYQFMPEKIRICQGEAENLVGYDQVFCLVLCAQDLCLFLNRDAGFVVSLETVDGKERDSFLDMLRKKTRKSILRDQNLPQRILTKLRKK